MDAPVVAATTPLGGQRRLLIILLGADDDVNAVIELAAQLEDDLINLSLKLLSQATRGGIG